MTKTQDVPFPFENMEFEVDFAKANAMVDSLDKAIKAMAHFGDDFDDIQVISDLRVRFAMASADSFRHRDMKKIALRAFT